MKTYLLSALALFVLATCLRAEEPQPETIITSNELELVSGEDENLFYFLGDVKITGNNLTATADQMVVTSLRQGKSPDGTIGQIGRIEKIVLEGRVKIEQAGREATAGLAEVYPLEGKVILMRNPVVRDAQGVVSGYRMELVKEERKARVFGDPDAKAADGRPTVKLPTLPDLGYQDKKPEQPDKANAND